MGGMPPPPWLLAPSPSMRREWIEIHSYHKAITYQMSPSMRREWIEMLSVIIVYHALGSPSMRREWIEILLYCGSLPSG